MKETGYATRNKSIFLLSIIAIVGIIAIDAQERNFNISFEARNEAIAAYNKGCKLIDSDKTNEGIIQISTGSDGKFY